MEKHPEIGKTLINQLLDAGTSIKANLEEAQAGQSRADFLHKNYISLKEAREINYWLRPIPASATFDSSITKSIIELETESEEIARIIGSIIVSA